jgi:hypothetical protein
MNLLLPLGVLLWLTFQLVALAMPVIAWYRRGAMAAAIACLAPVGVFLFAPVLMVVYAAFETPPLSWTSPALWLGLVVALGGGVLAWIGVRAAFRPQTPPGHCAHCGHPCREGERCTECGRLHQATDTMSTAARGITEIKPKSDAYRDDAARTPRG